MTRSLHLLLDSTITLAFFAGPVFAQTPISGTVKSEFGLAQPNVRVAAKLVRNNQPVSDIGSTDENGKFDLNVAADLGEPIVLEFLPPEGSNLAPSSLRLLNSERPNPPIINLQNINKLLAVGGVQYELEAPKSEQERLEGNEQMNEMMSGQLAKYRDFEDIYLRYLSEQRLSAFDADMLAYIKRYMQTMPNLVQSRPRDRCGHPMYAGNPEMTRLYSSRRSATMRLFKLSDNDSTHTAKCCTSPRRGLLRRLRFFRR